MPNCPVCDKERCPAPKCELCHGDHPTPPMTPMSTKLEELKKECEREEVSGYGIECLDRAYQLGREEMLKKCVKKIEKEISEIRKDAKENGWGHDSIPGWRAKGLREAIQAIDALKDKKTDV